MWSWEKGRQGTGYEKFCLFRFLNVDCYILRYNVGDGIPWHTDVVPGRKHWRLNYVLKKARGGYLLLDRELGFRIVTDRLVFFRSDIVRHKVTTVLEGQRIVITFGIAL